jgi:PAS domain S-box-containing protein
MVKFKGDGASATVLRIGLGLIVATCVALVGLEVYSVSANLPALRRDRALVAHTFEVIGAAQALDRAMQDAERGQRGYLLTGEQAYLQPYEQGIAAVPGLLDRLKMLTADDPVQRERVPLIRRQVDIKLGELSRTLAAKRAGDEAGAVAIVRSNVGLAAMRSFEELLDAMIAREISLRFEREGRTDSNEAATTRIAIAAGVLSLLVAGLGVAFVLVAFRDTRRTAEARRREDERYAHFIQSVTEYAIYTLDPAGNVTEWNAGAERIKGYTAEEMLGQNFSRFYTAEDRDAGVPQRVLEAAAREGKFEGEGWRVRKNGERFRAHVVVHAQHDPSGKLIGFAKITRDVTERLTAEAALEQARAALAQSQKMESLGQLTGGIAHDFNNLLTVIRGATDMYRRRYAGTDPDALRYIDAVQTSAERAASLTQRLLAFSRRQPLDPKPLDANRLVAGMTELLRRTLGESVALETVLAGGLWWVLADANHLESAILNLAINGRDAMPEGGKLTIETANIYLDQAYANAHEEVSAGQYTMIAVSDTGHGMPPEVAERAFEPFFTTKDVGRGTGLGLSQVYGFVKQSGGHVKIYSELGEGTTVKIYLPRITASAEPLQVHETAAVARATTRETILLAEDSDEVRRFAADALIDLGYRVIETPNGAAALKELDANGEIALLLTDVGLPDGMNGRQLADAALARRPALKVLFMTGYARNAIVHHGRLDPGVEVVLKPFTQAELGNKVRQVLDAD